MLSASRHLGPNTRVQIDALPIFVERKSAGEGILSQIALHVHGFTTPNLFYVL